MYECFLCGQTGPTMPVDTSIDRRLCTSCHVALHAVQDFAHLSPDALMALVGLLCCCLHGSHLQVEAHEKQYHRDPHDDKW